MLIQILTDWFNLGCTKLQFFGEINSRCGNFLDKVALFLWQECDASAIIMKLHCTMMV